MTTHITAILWKQLKDTLKNKTILIQFVMFPVLTCIMENTVKPDGMPSHFFANLFAVMYLGMAPLTGMAAVISEDKEKNTLRVLLMSNVKSFEYLLGMGFYILGGCLIGTCIIGFAGNYQGIDFVKFILLMSVGIAISVLLGATIGLFSKNQMMATSISIPVMMVLSFLPMLSMFNDTIGKISKWIYSEQIYLLFNQIENLKLSTETLFIVMANTIIVIGLFVYAYKKNGIEH